METDLSDIASEWWSSGWKDTRDPLTVVSWSSFSELCDCLIDACELSCRFDFMSLFCASGGLVTEAMCLKASPLSRIGRLSLKQDLSVLNSIQHPLVLLDWRKSSQLLVVFPFVEKLRWDFIFFSVIEQTLDKVWVQPTPWAMIIVHLLIWSFTLCDCYLFRSWRSAVWLYDRYARAIAEHPRTCAMSEVIRSERRFTEFIATKADGTPVVENTLVIACRVMIFSYLLLCESTLQCSLLPRLVSQYSLIHWECQRSV